MTATGWLEHPEGVQILADRGGPFQTVAFRQAIASSSRWRDVSAAVLGPDSSIAALAMFERLGIGVAVPYGYGGLVATRQLSIAEQADALHALRRAAGVRRLLVREVGESGTGISTTVLDLEDRQDPLDRMHKTARYQVRRAQREGLRVECTTDPETFLTLYERAAERFDSTYPSDLIRGVARGGGARFYIGFLDGTAVGASMALVGRSEWMYWLGALDEAGRAVHAGYATVLELARDALRHGVTRVNLGASEVNGRALAGVVHFKQQLGGRSAVVSEVLVAGRWGRAEAAVDGAVMRPLWGLARRSLGGRLRR